jgi:tungstate transport system substrate-binding protein
MAQMRSDGSVIKHQGYFRVLAVGAAAALAAAGLAVAASPSQAIVFTPTQLTVVGTSDVSDSNLMAAVIKPGFEAAHPEYTLNYVPKGTGAAITYAEAGTASAMIVHAASLENQFVGSGYSLEKYGRAIFWGDFVLAGPASDPAHVLTDAPHDIVTAFERIAAAGAAGKATFVSRGSNPGTTVQEHAIWSLANSSADLTKCNVTAGDGGGQSPSTVSGACASPVGSLPSWYYASGKNQAQNVLLADSCPAATFPNGNCYVLTDRGTFQYLSTLASPAGISHLSIVTRDNGAAARGGSTELINSFHAYGIKPAAVPAGSQIDTVGATALLNWITSPAAQQAIGNYLDAANDAAFVPSASPKITIASQTVSTTAGLPLIVHGNVANAVPGTPVLNGIPVNLKAGSTVVARATTDAAGNFVLSYVPTTRRSYTVTTGQISKIENSTLSPVFGDLLAPATANVDTVSITGAQVLIYRALKSGHTGIRLTGRILPQPSAAGAVLRLFAAHPGRKLHLVHQISLPTGSSTFSKRFVLGRGRWNYELRYAEPGVFKTTSTRLRYVRLR